MSTGTQVQVVMPQMGVSVSEGTVTKWLKQVGEQIEQDEPLLEISTDKVDTEVPSPGAGTVVQILVPEGETVEVGTVLALIGAAGSQAAEPVTAEPPAEAPAQSPPQEPPALEPPAEQAPAAPAPRLPHRRAGACGGQRSAPCRRAGFRTLGQRKELRLSGRRTDCRRARGRPLRRPWHRDRRPRHEEGHPRLHRVGSPGPGTTGRGATGTGTRTPASAPTPATRSRTGGRPRAGSGGSAPAHVSARRGTAGSRRTTASAAACRPCSGAARRRGSCRTGSGRAARADERRCGEGSPSTCAGRSTPRHT